MRFKYYVVVKIFANPECETENLSFKASFEAFSLNAQLKSLVLKKCIHL